MTDRFTCLPLLLLLIAAGPGFPLCPAASAGEVNSLEGKATSIQFLTFGGGSRAPFRTSGLYVKRHLTERTALRAGVDFSVDESSGDSPPTVPIESVENRRSYSVTVSGEVWRYFDATGPVTLFLGVGPYWTRGRYHADYSDVDPGGPTGGYYSYEYETRSWELGGTASVGFEWFFSRKLSALGRVGASFGLGQRHAGSRSEYFSGTGVPQKYLDHLNSDTAAAGASSAALGVSAYF